MLTKHQIGKIKEDVIRGDASLANVFSALGDTGRVRILKILLRHDDICVSDIANILGVSVPAASRQLKILETAGLVERTRQGQMICYRVHNKGEKAQLIVRLIQKVEK